MGGSIGSGAAPPEDCLHTLEAYFMVPVAASDNMVPPALAAVTVVLATAPTALAAPFTMLIHPVHNTRRITIPEMSIQRYILHHPLVEYFLTAWLA